MAERQPRVYLILIRLGKPQPEHQNIPERIKLLSHGDFTHVMTDPKTGSGSYLVKTEHFADEIRGHFAQVLLNGDQSLVIEVGSDWWATDLGKAQGWLNTHVPRR